MISNSDDVTKINKKIVQKLKELLVDRSFIEEVESLRNGLCKDLVRETAQIFENIQKITNEAISVITKKDISFESFEKTKGGRKILKTLSEYLHATIVVKENPILEEASALLVRKYKLIPAKSWINTISTYILTGEIKMPDFFDLSPNLVLLEEGEKIRLNEKLTHLGLELELNKENFGIFIEEKSNELPIVYIQLFGNTCKEDIVSGWGKIAKIRDKIYAEKRYYPKRSLDLAAKILDMDLNKNNLSDWEKQGEIFGEIPNLDFGRIENQRKKKIKNIRQRYNKRSGPKS